MGLRVTVDLRRWPTVTATPTVMRAIGELAKAAVVQRTFREGRGLDDKPMRAYSTEPMSVYLPSETARRLAPKGGTPLYRKRKYVRRGKSQSGYMPAPQHLPLGALIGRKYEGGYREFKRASRKGYTRRTVEVDLTLSGELSRSLRVTNVTRTYAIVAVQGGALKYAAGTNQRRPWFGLSPDDRVELQQSVADIIVALIEQQTGGPIR